MSADARPDLITADDLDAGLCTIDGSNHDWRPYRYQRFGQPHTSMRCVWCHVIMCGDYGEVDGCVEPYHHRGDHRTSTGETWPLGGDRDEDQR